MNTVDDETEMSSLATHLNSAQFYDRHIDRDLVMNSDKWPIEKRGKGDGKREGGREGKVYEMTSESALYRGCLT